MRRERIKGDSGIIHGSKDQHDQAGTAFNSFSVFVLPACMWLVEEHTSREGYTSGLFLSGIAYLGLRRGRSNRLGETPLQDTHAAHTLVWEVCSKSSAIL